MSHPLLVRAAQLLEQARALNDEFEDKTKMPAEVAGKIDVLLNEAGKCRKQVDREMQINDFDGYLKSPDYKHDMGPFSGDDKDDKSHGRHALGDYLSPKEKDVKRREAFWEYVKKGKGQMAPETKADLVEDATGELLVPHDWAGIIEKDIARQSVLRGLAFVRPTNSNKVDIGSMSVSASGWGKLETGATAPDMLNAPTRQTIEVFDQIGEVKLGRDELEDAADDLEAIVGQAVSMQFAQDEDTAFSVGNGTDRPLGIATDTSVTQGIATASAPAVVLADDLKKLMFAIPYWAFPGAVWLGHSGVEQQISLLKDGNNNYIWQPSAAVGNPPTLFGKPWYRADGLPAPTTTADATGGGSDKSLFFGDLSRGYMIADRRGLMVQRLSEKYAESGKVALLFTRRVGGAVIRPKALAWLKV